MRRIMRAAIFVIVVTVGFAGVAAAQVSVDTSTLDGAARMAARWKTQLGPNINRLSGAARNFIHFGEQWQQLKATASAMARNGLVPTYTGDTPVSPKVQPLQLEFELAGMPAPQLVRARPVSQPTLDYTRFSGAVQSESSTAWCGKNAVVGFNDSGSFWQTGGFYPISGQSFNGYAASTNHGKKFTDKGSLPVGSLGTFLEGDPVLACSNANDFYYASLFEDSSAGAMHECLPFTSYSGKSEISLSISTDGGQTFGSPIVAVSKDACFHFLDKDWMTVDPQNPNHIFVTYTDFDSSNSGNTGNSCGGPGSGVARTAIEMVTSSDGGTTWSTPTVIKEVCGAPFVQGSQVAVDPSTGDTYVAWESFPADFFHREIDIASSADGFATTNKVASVDPVGDGDYYFGLQGFIRDFEFPSLAIGRGTKNAGTLYVTWNDGDVRVGDAWTALLQSSGYGDGKYGFSDVMYSSSTDGGATWSAPLRVNKPSAVGTPQDHYQPAIATDKTGAVAICWYDRRRDVNNFLVDRFCGKLNKKGGFSNKRVTSTNYPSVVNQDLLIAFDYMGDYDQLASDMTNTKAGFRDSFVNTRGGNQSVEVNKF